jgi:hypothetical protein
VVKSDENDGELIFEGLHLYGNFPDAAGEAVFGAVGATAQRAPDGTRIELRDSTFEGNQAPALAFEATDAPLHVVVDGLTASGNTGFVSTGGAATCEVSGSSVAETGVSDVAPCSDGGGNTFAP